MRDLLARRGQASPLHIEEYREIFPTYNTIELAWRGQASPLHIEEHREIFPTYNTIAVIFCY